jgi:hypothetical protein
MNLARVLDREFKRVATAEQISMEDLVNEAAALTDCSTRQLYNYRSGKWSLPGEMIPKLCKRFRSRALLDELAAGCAETSVNVPEAYELTRLVSQTVRADMSHFEKFLDAFEDGVIESHEMEKLRESGARVIEDVRRFEAIAEADFNRRQSLPRR